MKKNYTQRSAHFLGVICLLLFLGISHKASAQCSTATGPTNDCSYGDAIDNFSIGVTNVSNSGCSGGGSGYTYFPSPIFNLTLGASYPVSFTVGGATYNQGVGIWIDMNGNGFFETSEFVWNSASAALTHTGTLNVPAVGTTGIVRMRIMCTYNVVPTAGQACTSNVGSYGETEDYQVNLVAPVIPGTNASAVAVVQPTDNDCGEISDSLIVRIGNSGTDTVMNMPFQVTLTGIVSTVYNDTLAQLNPGDTVDVFVDVLNTEAGGMLSVELITQDTADIDNADDTLNVMLNLMNATPLMIAGPDSICYGEMATLIVMNPDSGETYTWYQDSVGGTMITTGDTLYTSALMNDTTFAVESSNGCRMYDMQMIYNMPLPTASFTYTAANDTFSFTGSAQFFTSVMWDFGDGNTDTILDPTHVYGTNGNFTVCFTAINDCDSVTFCDTISSAVNVIPGYENAEISIYPNPADEDITVRLSNMKGLTGKWIITDLNGRVVYSKDFDLQSGEDKTSVSLKDVAAGSYLFKFSTEGYSYESVIIKR